MASPQPKRHERGFTLIEALMALLVLMIGMLAMIQIIPGAFTNVTRDGERLQAVAAGQIYLESLREYIQNFGTNANLPAPPDVSVHAGTSMTGSGDAATSPGSFTISSNGCQLVAGSTLRYYCVVLTKWTENGQDRTVSVQSYVTSQKS